MTQDEIRESMKLFYRDCRKMLPIVSVQNCSKPGNGGSVNETVSYLSGKVFGLVSHTWPLEQLIDWHPGLSAFFKFLSEQQNDDRVIELEVLAPCLPNTIKNYFTQGNRPNDVYIFLSICAVMGFGADLVEQYLKGVYGTKLNPKHLEDVVMFGALNGIIQDFKDTMGYCARRNARGDLEAVKPEADVVFIPGEYQRQLDRMLREAGIYDSQTNSIEKMHTDWFVTNRSTGKLSKIFNASSLEELWLSAMSYKREILNTSAYKNLHFRHVIDKMMREGGYTEYRALLRAYNADAKYENFRNLMHGEYGEFHQAATFMYFVVRLGFGKKERESIFRHYNRGLKVVKPKTMDNDYIALESIGYMMDILSEDSCRIENTTLYWREHERIAARLWAEVRDTIKESKLTKSKIHKDELWKLLDFTAQLAKAFSFGQEPEDDRKSQSELFLTKAYAMKALVHAVVSFTKAVPAGVKYIACPITALYYDYYYYPVKEYGESALDKSIEIFRYTENWSETVNKNNSYLEQGYSFENNCMLFLASFIYTILTNRFFNGALYDRESLKASLQCGHHIFASDLFEYLDAVLDRGKQYARCMPPLGLHAELKRLLRIVNDLLETMDY